MAGGRQQTVKSRLPESAAGQEKTAALKSRLPENAAGQEKTAAKKNRLPVQK